MQTIFKQLVSQLPPEVVKDSLRKMYLVMDKIPDRGRWDTDPEHVEYIDRQRTGEMAAVLRKTYADQKAKPLTKVLTLACPAVPHTAMEVFAAMIEHLPDEALSDSYLAFRMEAEDKACKTWDTPSDHVRYLDGQRLKEMSSILGRAYEKRQLVTPPDGPGV